MKKTLEPQGLESVGTPTVDLLSALLDLRFFLDRLIVLNPA